MIRKAILILFAAVLLAGCGYRLSGTGAFLPGHVKTILIRTFENETSRYQAEQFVTFAVRDEFIRRVRLQLADSMDSADAVLEGKITSFAVTPVSYAESAADKFQVSIVLDIRLMDLINNNDNIIVVEEADMESQNGYAQTWKLKLKRYFNL